MIDVLNIIDITETMRLSVNILRVQIRFYSTREYTFDVTTDLTGFNSIPFDVHWTCII